MLKLPPPPPQTKGIKAMTTRFWTAKQVRETVKALRDAGYQIIKDGYKYSSLEKDWTDYKGHVFYAAKHSGGNYMVRYHPELFME